MKDRQTPFYRHDYSMREIQQLIRHKDLQFVYVLHFIRLFVYSFYSSSG